MIFLGIKRKGASFLGLGFDFDDDSGPKMYNKLHMGGVSWAQVLRHR